MKKTILLTKKSHLVLQEVIQDELQRTYDLKDPDQFNPVYDLACELEINTSQWDDFDMIVKEDREIGAADFIGDARRDDLYEKYSGHDG